MNFSKMSLTKIPKRKSAATLSLDPTRQKSVAKETKRIKKELEDGTIQLRNTRKEKKIKAEESRGLIYVGHIPHGFYEDQMRGYFKQFGTVTNVKVCRSRTTGNSKGYGYIEFLNPEVARIAADTMNNYIMFKKRLVTEYVPYEKRPKHLFHGKSSNTKHTSAQTRSGKQKFSRNQVLDDKTVAQKRKRTLKKLESKKQKLRDLGIQCNVEPVGLDDVTEIKEIKLERQLGVNSDEDSEVEYNRPSEKRSKSKEKPPGEPAEDSRSLAKSLTTIKSRRLVLTKSLDSVKALLSTGTECRDEGTQTLNRRIKKEKTRQGKGRIGKSVKKPLKIDKETVNTIAKELIRKQGDGLLTLVPKPRKKIKKM